eukprot:12248981-Ditylum_brightwellii.AAC.1
MMGALPLSSLMHCLLELIIEKQMSSDIGKASEDHLPDNIMRNTGTLSRNIAIAAADLTEWVPMFSALKP